MLQSPGAHLTVASQPVALPRGRRTASDNPQKGVQVFENSGIQAAPAASSPLLAVAPSPSHPLTLSPSPPEKRGLVIERRAGKWVFAGYTDTIKPAGKRPGLQGPIDDAFTSRFLCVRGTGKAWNPATQAWIDATCAASPTNGAATLW